MHMYVYANGYVHVYEYVYAYVYCEYVYVRSIFNHRYKIIQYMCVYMCMLCIRDPTCVVALQDVLMGHLLWLLIFVCG